MKLFFSFTGILFFLSAIQAQSVRIPIEPARWYQLNETSGNLDKLFDGDKDSKAFTGWSKILSNYEAYYPLLDGEQMTIDSVRFYDKEGVFTNVPMRLYAITQNWERKLIATFAGEAYNVWVGPYPARPKVFALDSSVSDVRYLLLNIYDNNFPGEIELYGTYKASDQTKLPVVNKPAPLKNLFGINGFPWNLVDASATWAVGERQFNAVRSFGGFRHYLDWRKLEEIEGRYTFSPMMGGGWHLDSIYQRLQEAGIEPLATFQTIPEWMMKTYPDSLQAWDNNPLRYGLPFDAPSSYLEMAKLGFQFAARFGRNKNIDSSLVSVYGVPQWTAQRVNQKKIGLGLLRYIECGNEQNKWWRGRKGYLSGREYAASLSAFYDGHKNTMGPGVGVKNADSTMVVVMNGIASFSTDYVKGMVDWCKEFRGYKPDGRVDLCFDVVNYHMYINDAGSSQAGGNLRGAAPEKGNATQVARDFLQLAAKELYGMPVWVTEQGYDENQGSPLRAIPIGNKTPLQTQADWTLRTGLLYAREGLDRSYFYEMYDASPGSGWKFGTMGLINKTDWTRKPAADFLYQTIRQFGEYTFRETLNSDPFVDRYEHNGQSMYTLLVPDEIGRTADYVLQLPGADSAIVYTPTIGSDTMQWNKIALAEGGLSLTVAETPIFVVPVAAKAGNQLRTAQRSPMAAANLAMEAETAEKKVVVFPNPAKGQVQVQNGTGGQWKVVVLDVNGSRLLEKAVNGYQTTIDLQTLAAGVYPVYILNEDGKAVFNQLLVKQ